jgi:tryptophan synthase beta chain
VPATVSGLPDATGHFDIFGGKFVPEALYAALIQLENEFHAAIADPAFTAELAALLADYTGRPSPITEVPRFAAEAGGALIVLQREDLSHTAAHSQQRAGQALLARRMGRPG